MIQRLHREQVLTGDPAAIWAFFATPRNLDALTPPNVSFKIVGEVPARMYPGQVIEYRIGILPGVKTRWLTEITQVREGSRFIDEQRISHGHFLRVLAMRWIGLAAGQGRHFALDTGSVSMLGHEHPGGTTPAICLWNAGSIGRRAAVVAPEAGALQATGAGALKAKAKKAATPRKAKATR